MRCTTASQIKQGKRMQVLRSAPREGSKLRQLYDLLQTNKGLPVEIYRDAQTLAAINSLQDYYGLDIRLVQRGYKKEGYGNNRPSYSTLAGEWFGRVYIDYVAERMEAAQ